MPTARCKIPDLSCFTASFSEDAFSRHFSRAQRVSDFSRVLFAILYPLRMTRKMQDSFQAEGKYSAILHYIG